MKRKTLNHSKTSFPKDHPFSEIKRLVEEINSLNPDLEVSIQIGSGDRDGFCVFIPKGQTNSTLRTSVLKSILELNKRFNQVFQKDTEKPKPEPVIFYQQSSKRSKEIGDLFLQLKSEGMQSQKAYEEISNQCPERLAPCTIRDIVSVEIKKRILNEYKESEGKGGNPNQFVTLMSKKFFREKSRIIRTIERGLEIRLSLENQEIFY